MKHRIDPEGTRLPIKLDTTSNGEFEPIALSRTNLEAKRLALKRQAATQAPGPEPQRFLLSSCGVASTLLAFNAANAAEGKRGGWFDLEPEAALEGQLARVKLDGKEFIFDVQGHFVDPHGAWLRKLPEAQNRCALRPRRMRARQEPGARSYLNCIGSKNSLRMSSSTATPT
jgi:hypothetical protein